MRNEALSYCSMRLKLLLYEALSASGIRKRDLLCELPYTSAYVRKCQHIYVSIRQHTSPASGIRRREFVVKRRHLHHTESIGVVRVGAPATYVIRQHTSYVSIRQQAFEQYVS